MDMKNIDSNSQVQTTNNKDNDYSNFDAISSNKKNEEKKEYDIWPVIGLYTYILFLVNTIYIITLIIYFISTLDEKTFFEWTLFITFTGLSESQYIIYSFCMFFCKDKIIVLDCYMFSVIISGIVTFISSLVFFTDDDIDQYFTTTYKVIFY